MKRDKRERLAAHGWRAGDAQEFLGLSEGEATFVEMKLALAAELRKKRRKRHLTQTQVAKMLESSQSRVAKMEAGDPTVSMDLLMRSLLAIGATRTDLATALSKTKAGSPDA